MRSRMLFVPLVLAAQACTSVAEAPAKASGASVSTGASAAKAEAPAMQSGGVIQSGRAAPASSTGGAAAPPSAAGGRAGSSMSAPAGASAHDAMMRGEGGASAGRAAMASAADASVEVSGPYTCQAKLAAHPPDPGGDGAQGSACCAGLGSCQLQGAIMLDLKASLGHDACKAGAGDADLRCAPKELKHNGVCHAQTGGAALEGRCLSRCLLAGDPKALLLTTTDCGAGDEQVCAACYDPVSGEATGACTLQPGDKPSEPAPTPFKSCGVYMGSGDAAGVCMPKSLATASGNAVAATLPQDSCAESEVCVPKLKSVDFNACFAECETSALVQAAGSKEGGCIPPYIAATSNPEAVTFLEQGSCAAGEVCAPCLDPTKDLAVSGACE